MEMLHFKAEWLPNKQKMSVALVFQGQTHAELFNKRQWNSFIKNLDTKPLRLGGLLIDIEGSSEQTQKFIEGAKQYLRDIDKAFRATGSTTFI